MSSISAIGIVTASRPESLRRTITSLVATSHASRGAPRFIIVDGSRTAADCRATQAVVFGAAAESGRSFQYVGPAEARDACRTWGVPAARRWAVSPGAVAANRNLLLLLTAGEQVLFVDDDIVADTRMFADRQPGLVVAGHAERREFRFASSRRAALATVRPAPLQLVQAHEALLGRTLKHLTGPASHDADVRETCDHMLAGLYAGRRLVVRMTFAGVVGDAAMYCPRRLLLSGDGSLRRHLWSSVRAFTTAMTSRDGVRIARTDYVTHNANCMTLCMGLANSTVSPPFPPIGGNEDGVFGALLAASDPAAIYGHLSVGVIHDSIRHSTYASGNARSACESRLSELLIGSLWRLVAEAGGASPAARLQRLGAGLQAIGALRPREFTGFVREVTLATRSREFRVAEAACAAPKCPRYWRRAFAEYRQTFLEHVASERFCLPVEFHDHGSLDAGYRHLAAFFRRFGELLSTWPEMWRTARQLNEFVR